MLEKSASHCDTVNDVLAMESLTSYDKVLQFVEEQESCQNMFFSECSDILLQEKSQDVTCLSNIDFLNADEKLSSKKTRVSKQPTEKKKLRQKRRRKEETECDDNDSLLLFRRSQKALRNEARHLNMKEVLSRSLSGTVIAANDVDDSLSHNISLEPQRSATWSPSLATSITNRFLSSVQQQKKQVFERLIQKELTNSQLSISRLTAEKGGGDEFLPELVIGDETAVMEPPLPPPTTTRTSSKEDVFGVDISTTFSQTDTTMPIPTTTTAAPINSQSTGEISEKEEQAQSEALMRKHELWRLRQRHLREKLCVEESFSHEKIGDNQRAGRAKLTLAATITKNTTNTTTSTRSVHVAHASGADVEGLTERLMFPQRSIIKQTQRTALGLSSDHINMIRRVNSFDNTSNQRVVVFKTKKKNEVSDDVSSTKQNVA